MASAVTSSGTAPVIRETIHIIEIKAITSLEFHADQVVY